MMIYDANIISMEKLIGKIFYYTYRMLYPRYGRSPFYAYIYISLNIWIVITTIAIIVTIHLFQIDVKNVYYKTISNVLMASCFILSYSYNFWVIYYKKKYRDIILTNKAKPWQCIIYALLYNIVLPLVITFILVYSLQ